MLRILRIWWLSRLIACCHIRDEEEDDDNNEEEEEEEEEDNKEEEAGRPGWEDEDNGGIATMTVVRTLADPALDLEIAWENLDLARAIVTRLVNGLPSAWSTTMTEGARLIRPPGATSMRAAGGRQDELLLNLAQIHVHLGNLGQ